MVNIGADLLAMGAVVQMLVPQVPVILVSIVAAIAIVCGLVLFSYPKVVLVMK